MLCIRRTLLVLMACLCTNAPCKDTEPFYEQLTRGVVRLEVPEPMPNGHLGPAKLKPQGTGFFVLSGNELFIVSARHVVAIRNDLWARVQLQNWETGTIEPFMLGLHHRDWALHPDNGDATRDYVDVGAMKLRVPIRHLPKSFRYDPEDPNTEHDNQLPSVDSEPPEPILVFGFPGSLGFTLREQRPIARLGIVSMSANRQFLKKERNGKFCDERCLLIDARMFPGNSGGPVMNQLRLGNSKPRLLGLVIATNRNLDFGVMEPVSRIRETLDFAKLRPASGRWIPTREQGGPFPKPDALNRTEQPSGIMETE